MDSDWAWALQGRYPGFCLTFIRDRDPATVAAALGGGPLETLTAEEAEQAFPMSLRGSLLRCGTVPGWSYCYEDHAPVAFLPSRREDLSTGTELVQVIKGGDGMNTACRMLDGRLAEQFEPGFTAASRGTGPALLRSRVDRFLADHPETIGVRAALHAVSDHVGTTVTRQELDGPLPTTFSTFVEPPSAPRPPDPGRIRSHFGELRDPRPVGGEEGE